MTHSKKAAGSLVLLAAASMMVAQAFAQTPAPTSPAAPAPAAEHLATAAHAVWGAGTARAQEWLAQYCHELKWGAPETVLAALRALPVAAAPEPAAKAENPVGSTGLRDLLDSLWDVS